MEFCIVVVGGCVDLIAAVLGYKLQYISCQVDANPNNQDDLGGTPTYYSIQHEHTEILEVLYECDAHTHNHVYVQINLA